MNNSISYRNDLDLIKGLAILAVVLYHMGISRSGFLGVDVFFVINGYFIMPKVIHDVSDGRFHYFDFLKKRTLRLLPLVLLVSVMTLIIGYWGMLPDDYENLCESVVATNLFSNNILASITTKNYWDVGNDYKPLMHTWYIGILYEFYIVFPIIVMLVKWMSKKLRFSFDKYVDLFILSLSIISVILFLDPSVTSGDRFYLLHYRFFELAFGGLTGLWIVNHRNNELYKNGSLSLGGVVILSLIMFFGIINGRDSNIEYNLYTGASLNVDSFIPQNILLLIIVMLTIVIIMLDNMRNRIVSSLVNIKILCLLGMMSYSIFIWHQPILAFYRYFESHDISLSLYIVIFVFVLVLSYLTYRFVEKKVTVGRLTIVVTLIALLFINGGALAIYMHAGVVRDIPELNINTNTVYRKMHAEYVDRIFSYDKDFPDNNKKINVFVIGNSFARDWGNILLESIMADKINLSYIYEFDVKYANRIKQADYIFIFDWKHNIPDYVWNTINSDTKVWGIGTKNFGESNGIIYKKRNNSDYFLQTVSINPNFFIINKKMKEEWNNNYVDLLAYIVQKDSTVIVFSDNHKYLSPDCRHLSKAGAEFFANRIDFSKIFQ